MSSESIGIGILGLGTVGQGVVRILSENSSQVVSRAGRPLKVVAAAVRELCKKRDYLPANVELTDDPASVLANPAVEIVIEAMGGLEPARSLTLRALQLGKHVVTANKA
ncbi:MAG: homoserine dehydrogenase, partial [Isosphaeraceae bacterium]